MAGLVEIIPGIWVQPAQITGVVAFRERQIGTATLPASVKVFVLSREALGWEFDGWQDAKAWAAHIATAVNEAAAKETP